MKHALFVLLSLYLCRVGYFGAGVSDAVIVTAMSTLYGFLTYMEQKVKKTDESMKKELEQVKSSVSALSIGRLR